jgi:hypothetical protein
LASSTADLWAVIAEGASRESLLWQEALRDEPDREPIFSPLTEARFALGVETIYEGYLVHYGRPRLFAPPDPDSALLLGDHLYAHGLVRIAELGSVEAVGDLAELISLCAQLRGDGREGDGPAWAATAAVLGSDGLASPRAALRDEGDAGPLARLASASAGDAAVEAALRAHAARFEDAAAVVR